MTIASKYDSFHQIELTKFFSIRVSLPIPSTAATEAPACFPWWFPAFQVAQEIVRSASDRIAAWVVPADKALTCLVATKV
mmetsp:Transcript_40495/g.74025  ORF Transcript_40495/g.74025 Transcript_40495/m.74025 type:complete len:80 (-) Transcript_40495:477-716(-)